MQTNIFGETEPLTITINEAAHAVGVSTATIRNWIKAGHLIALRGHVTTDSLTHLQNEVIGSQRLTSRANKLQKDLHNHEKLTLTIERLLSSTKSSDEIGRLYEESLSESHRNKEGIYYTHADIVEDMLSSISGNVENCLFLDPCCGSGNFIVAALDMGFRPENIYGFDVDANAVAITKKRIQDKTGYNSSNVIQGDFLESVSDVVKKYDYIFTNPPWGKKLSKIIKNSLGARFNAGLSVDTSSLFFYASLNCLADNGKLGFLLPASFFNIATFQDVRNTALNLRIEKLIDYGKPFKGLLTKAQAIILSKKSVQSGDMVQCESTIGLHLRPQVSFQKNPKSIINFETCEQEAHVIDHVFQLPHITLRDNAQWGLGIVTGNNKKYCCSKRKEGVIPVFKGADITADGLHEPSTFIPSDLNLYQQVAPRQLYEATEKLIYRFISSNLCFYNDKEQCYILNSANMMVLTPSFPLTGNQLADLLNSSFMNWLFQKIFNTHKILRSDLEVLPIHSDYFCCNKSFSENSFLDFLNIEKAEDGTYRIKK